jgi:hypothetical protein
MADDEIQALVDQFEPYVSWRAEAAVEMVNAMRRPSSDEAGG